MPCFSASWSATHTASPGERPTILRSTVQARGSLEMARRTASPPRSAPSRVSCRKASYPCSKSSRSQKELPRGISIKKLWRVSNTALARLTYSGATPGSGRAGGVLPCCLCGGLLRASFPPQTRIDLPTRQASSHPWPTLSLAGPAGRPAPSSPCGHFAITEAINQQRPQQRPPAKSTAYGALRPLFAELEERSRCKGAAGRDRKSLRCGPFAVPRAGNSREHARTAVHEAPVFSRDFPPAHGCSHFQRKSGRQDLNLRPPGPQPERSGRCGAQPPCLLRACASECS